MAARCDGTRVGASLRCNGSQYKCLGCGSIGCTQNKPSICSAQLFDALEKCGNCGAVGKRELLAADQVGFFSTLMHDANPEAPAMIFVVEVPPAGEPQAWFAFDEDDLLRKVAVGVGCEPWEIWDERSPRDLLEMADASPDTPGATERFPALFALAEAHGWDTPLVRADFVEVADDDPALYRATAVTPLEAAIAALQAREGEMRLYRSEDIALSAVDLPDPLYDGPGGWRARHALRQQLIATEVLADDH